jgi:hypothetical protein
LFASLAIVVASANAEPVNLVKATSGYLYFNRPGASMAIHDGELADCLGATGSPAPTRSSPMLEMGVAGNAVENAVQNRMLSGWSRAAADIDVELCMVVRGWRLVRLDDETGRRLARLDQARLAAELAPWVSASSPPGEIVRTFNNDAAYRDTIQDRSPQNASRVLLSQLAIGANVERPAQAVVWAPSQGGRVIAPTELATLHDVPAGEALVLVALSGPSSLRAGVSFGREVADEQSQEAFQADLHGSPTIGRGAVGRLFAFLVPAGRWRILAARSNTFFCLGAPSFEAPSRAVVFAGAFDLGAAKFAPDMSIETIHRDAPIWPAGLADAQAAQWENGATSHCAVTLIGPDYALEFDGFPYRPGYVWGGARTPAQH